jgi:hypothetical protein
VSVSASQVKKPSVVEDFIDIFYAPSAVFARRMSGGFWAPALIVTLLIGLIFFGNSAAMEPIIEAEIEKSMEAAMRSNPNLTPEMMASSRAFGMTMAKIMVFVMTPLAIALVGLVLWLAGKLVDAKQTLAAAMMVAAYAYVPRVVEAIAGAVQGFMIDTSTLTSRYQLSLSAARFFNPDTTSPLLLAALGRIDVFVIWGTILLAIGLSVTGKIPRSRAAIAAIIVWVAGALPVVFQAMQG